MRQVSYVPDDYSRYVQGLDLQGDYAYLCYCGNQRVGMSVVDISDYENPEIIGRANINYDYMDIEVDGDYAYALGTEYFHVFDISNPGQPYLTGEINLEHLGFTYYSYSLTISGDYVYATTYFDGIKVFDVSDPERPTITAYYDTPGRAWEIGVIDNLVYTADGTSLGIYRNTLMDVPEPGTGNRVPMECILYPAYPNPFNSSSNIKYYVQQTGYISLNVYNLAGRKVMTLSEGKAQSGVHSVVFNGDNLTSGLFFVRLETSDGVFTEKVVLGK